MDSYKLDPVLHPFKNFSKFSKITLGTDKPVHKTEASSNYKDYSLALNVPIRATNIKLPTFSLGSHQQPYLTTASSSFEHHNSPRTPKQSVSPSQNIHFGTEKVKKISIVQSEYTEKKVGQGVDLGKIKEIHNNRHFVFGNFQNEYKSSSTDYRAYSTTPTRKAENNNNSVSVVLGNYKQTNLTETKEKFSGFKAMNLSQTVKGAGKKSNFVFGNDKDVMVATSRDTYRGEQVSVRDSIQNIPAKGNNVVLGKNIDKWRSSYNGSFQEKELKGFEKVVGSKKTNFDLGFHRENVKSVCQESYTGRIGERAKAVLQDKIHVYLGGFKNNFVNNSENR